MSDWIVRLIEQTGYLGVGFLMFLETVFPPIPSEIIMSIAGVAAGQGKMSLGWVIAAGTAGAMLGNILWYLAARALGIVRLKPIINRWGRWITMNWAEVQRAERDHDRGRGRAEDLVDLAVVLAQLVARAGEQRGPASRAERGGDHEIAKPHLEQSGRDRHQAAHGR